MAEGKGTAAIQGALGTAGAGAAIGTAIFPGVGTAIGAIGGALVGGLSGYLAADKKYVNKTSLSIGPGDMFAGMREGELGKDYKLTEYVKEDGPNALEQGLGILNTAVQVGGAVAGSLPTGGGTEAVAGATSKFGEGATISGQKALPFGNWSLTDKANPFKFGGDYSQFQVSDAFTTPGKVGIRESLSVSPFGAKMPTSKGGFNTGFKAVDNSSLKLDPFTTNIFNTK